MTDRIYSRKEVLEPGVGLPKEVVSAAQLPCVGVSSRSTTEGLIWLVEIEVGTAKKLQTSIAQLDLLEKEQQAAKRQVVQLKAEAEAENRRFRLKIGDLQRRLTKTERLCNELAVGNAHLLQKVDTSMPKGNGRRSAPNWLEFDDLQRRLSDSERLCNELALNNAQLLKNIADPKLEGRGARSPKNYLEVAKERHTNFGRPGIQGGDGGLQKK